jgi:hypothetical protein
MKLRSGRSLYAPNSIESIHASIGDGWPTPMDVQPLVKDFSAIDQLIGYCRFFLRYASPEKDMTMHRLVMLAIVETFLRNDDLYKEPQFRMCMRSFVTKMDRIQERPAFMTPYIESLRMYT